jgi:arylsulfatase A-like enzyme
MKKRLPLAILTLLTVFLVWLARPLKSHEWDIDFDPDLQSGKDEYLTSLSRNTEAKGRPNVIVILADDLGLTDLSFYGSPHLDTPNIDSIAEDGLAFSQAYATAPICSPSRAGLLTGRYQNRYGFDSQPMNRYARSRLEYWGARLFVETYPMFPINNPSIPHPDQILRQGIPPTEIILSEALSSAGYRSDAVGKWHLGYGELQHPNARGFNSFYGFLEAFTYFADPERPDIVSWQFDEFSEKHIWRQERTGYSAIQRNGDVIDEDEHLTDAIAREAVSRIHHAASSDDPFFLYVPFSAPHTPFQALKSYTDRFQNVEDPRERIYYALIAQLDDAVGQILEALIDTGVDENTLVIFSSDNGGATYTGATGNDPLRGGKMSHFEGGLSVPLMMKWPGRISSGRIVDDPVILADLFPTVLKAADLPLPQDRPIDGVNLLEYGPENPNANRTLFWRSDYNSIVLHNNWKLMMNGKDGKIWLYDLSEDREENHNLAESRPEIVEELRSLFLEWNQDMAPASWPRVMDYYYDENEEGYWFAT